MQKQQPISVQNYQSKGGFIHHYQKLVKDTVIPYQYEVLWDKIPGVEKSHVAQNFINAAAALQGKDVKDGFYGMVFQDSDAAKWIEAAAYSLAILPDASLEQKVDEFIALIGAAQDKDGYLDTYFTIKDQEKRWKNLLEAHELYCAGHMMEAACAYYESTGKRSLLDIMLKNVNCLYQLFMEQKKEGYPGHPEVELALMRMYHLTGEKHCLELAGHFIKVRGKDPAYFEKEVKTRDWRVWGSDGKDYQYQQNHKPVAEQTDAVGHAVRAVYLYTGMADYAMETEDQELLTACHRLWESITKRRMYVTGAIGSTVQGEAFTVDYDLPGDTAYGETCASIGLMFFASRMLQQEVNRTYSDVMELAFYNTVLAGMQLDGKKFFYVNPLECMPGISGAAVTHRHVLPNRPGWYTCACCPPNVARLISSFGKYAYGENETTGFCHLFAEGEVEFGNGLCVKCTTKYPYEFTISYQVTEAKEGQTLAVRIPAYSDREGGWRVLKNGQQVGLALEQGYCYLPVAKGDQVTVELDGSPRWVYPSSKVPRLSGQKALKRGPLVYCFEGVDNEGSVRNLRIPGEKVQIEAFDSKLLDGIAPIKMEAAREEDKEQLYDYQPAKRVPCQAVAVPYYTWGNRGENEMRVWMFS